MINTLYKWSTPGYGGIFVCLFLASMMGVILGVMAIATTVGPEPTTDVDVRLLLLTLPLMFGILSSIILIVDNIINFSVKYMTRGKRSSKNFIFRKCVSDVEPEDFCGFALFITGSTVGFVIMFLIILIYVALFASAVASLISIMILSGLGIYFGLLKAGRFIFDVSEKLAQHVNDPDAHQKKSKKRRK